MVKFGKLTYILPDLLIRGMENMCAVLMYMNTAHHTGINIACNMLPTVNHQNSFSLLLHLIGENRSK